MNTRHFFIVLLCIGALIRMPIAYGQTGGPTDREVRSLVNPPTGTIVDCRNDPFYQAAEIFVSKRRLHELEPALVQRLGDTAEDARQCALAGLRLVPPPEKAEGLRSTVEKTLGEWSRDILPVVILLVGGGFVVLILRGASIARRRWGSPDWRVILDGDADDFGVVREWQMALASPKNVSVETSGLFNSAAVATPQTLIVALADCGIDDARKATDKLVATSPKIQGFEVSWILMALIWCRAWTQSPRRSLAASVRSADKSASLRVDVIDRHGRRLTVADATTWHEDKEAPAAIRRLAEHMAIRTSYLVGSLPTGQTPEGRIKLIDGVSQLNAYVNQQRTDALEQAAEMFAETRRMDPQDLHVTLYEGIARELLEDHDSAANLFQRVIEGAQEQSALRTRARYNLAVSYLRRYTVASLVRAEELLDGPTGVIVSRDTRPPEMRYMARAALANVIAHKFIFWDQIEPHECGDFATWTEERKREKRDQLESWRKAIELIEKEVKAALQSQKQFKESPSLAAQLEWLMANAKGNAHLCMAKHAAQALGLADEARTTALEMALECFKLCEILVPAGVETLTNIATTLLELDRPSDALVYTRRARSLNPAYEYAYYREALAICRRDGDHICRTFLEEAARQLRKIGIPSFQNLFQKLRVGFHDR